MEGSGFSSSPPLNSLHIVKPVSHLHQFSTLLAMDNLTEKQLLGVKMMHEFFGQDLFDALKANSVGLAQIYTL